jgi:hypothetical protein
MRLEETDGAARGILEGGAAVSLGRSDAKKGGPAGELVRPNTVLQWGAERTMITTNRMMARFEGGRWYE